MDKKFTQPDQDNMNAKMKFVSNDRYEAPLFRNICDFQHNDLMYGADGRLRNEKTSMTTQYTKNSKGYIDDDIMDDKFDRQFFPGFSTLDTKKKCMFNEEEMLEDEHQSLKSTRMGKQEKNPRYNCSEKSRYIDHSSYVPGGSMETGGFGNIDNFSRPKYGVSTRNTRETISDKEIDRFHYTFRNYQHPHTGSNPLPEDTRHRNKQFI
jgi:hypothetical protein